jgi:hypothetical protein
MTRTLKVNKTAHARKLCAKHPEMTAKEIATQAKCDLAIVYKIRKAMKEAEQVEVEALKEEAKAQLVEMTYAVSQGRSKGRPTNIEHALKSVVELSVTNKLLISIYEGNVNLTTEEGKEYYCEPHQITGVIQALNYLDTFTTMGESKDE